MLEQRDHLKEGIQCSLTTACLCIRAIVDLSKIQGQDGCLLCVCWPRGESTDVSTAQTPYLANVTPCSRMSGALTRTDILKNLPFSLMVTCRLDITRHLHRGDYSLSCQPILESGLLKMLIMVPKVILHKVQ